MLLLIEIMINQIIKGIKNKIRIENWMCVRSILWLIQHIHSGVQKSANKRFTNRNISVFVYEMSKYRQRAFFLLRSFSLVIFSVQVIYLFSITILNSTLLSSSSMFLRTSSPTFSCHGPVHLNGFTYELVYWYQEPQQKVKIFE